MPRALHSDKAPYGPGVAFSHVTIRLTCWINQSVSFLVLVLFPLWSSSIVRVCNRDLYQHRWTVAGYEHVRWLEDSSLDRADLQCHGGCPLHSLTEDWGCSLRLGKSCWSRFFVRIPHFILVLSILFQYYFYIMLGSTLYNNLNL